MLVLHGSLCPCGLPVTFKGKYNAYGGPALSGSPLSIILTSTSTSTPQTSWAPRVPNLCKTL